jgi:hypothetical protein
MSGHSESDEPSANHELKPSKEIGSKMRPLNADAFHDLLRRAAIPPVQPIAPKAK